MWLEEIQTESYNPAMKRTNLLHLITALEPAGAENLLVNIVRKLDKRRFHVVVGYIYGSGTLATEIKRAGVKVIDLSRKGRIDPWLMIKLFLLIRKEKIKIVHTHLVHASIVGRIAAKLAGVKSIITTRHYAYYRKERSLVNWIERKTAVFNDNSIAISNAVKEYMVNREKYEPDRITMIYNSVDLGLFDSGDRNVIPRNNNFLIGSVGRLHPSKGYDTLLKSMPQVIEKFPQVKLMIAGNGTEKDHLEKLCTQLYISDKVIFLGRKTPEEIRNLLREINLFVLASNWEGFGLAAVEAMASGIPVVTTKVGGLPEIVEDGRTGFLVPPDQPHTLAERIIYLLKNRNLSIEMGREGRKRVETLFSLNNMIMKLESLYRELLNQETI